MKVILVDKTVIVHGRNGRPNIEQCTNWNSVRATLNRLHERGVVTDRHYKKLVDAVNRKASQS